MEFIPESLFNSDLGQDFLARVVFMPRYKNITDSYNMSPQQAFEYTKTMICGGSTTVPISFTEVTFDPDIGFGSTGRILEIAVESTGDILNDYKKKVTKLNDTLTNLKDCLTSIITSSLAFI